MAISVAPPRLDFVLEKNQSAASSLTIQNLNPDPTFIRVVPAAFQEFIAVTPQQFELAPGRSQRVEVAVRAKKNLSTVLKIQAQENADASLAIQTGIELPVEIRVENSFGLVSVFIALGMIVSILFILKISKQH